MKKTMVILSLLTSVGSIAQQNLPSIEKSDKKIEYGIHLGLTNTLLKNVKTSTHEDVNYMRTNIRLGFGMGVEANFKLNKSLELHNTLGLVFHESHFEYVLSDTTSIKHNPGKISVEFSPQIKWRLSKKKNSIYLVSGPDFRWFLNKKKINTSDELDFAINLGIGFDKAAEFFTIAPEIKYTYGINNRTINLEHSIYTKYAIHTISLILHFRD